METLQLKWTDGNDGEFRRFYADTEQFYNEIAGGADKRQSFIPHNLSESIPYVVIAYSGQTPVGCCGLRPYSEDAVEIKRLWVGPAYRGHGAASAIMDAVETRARELGFGRAVLQTRPAMRAAVSLYQRRGYKLIPNYPPYDKLDGAVCYELEL